MLELSLVIVSENNFLNLEKAINSLIKNKFPRTKYEIIIADNGSTGSQYEKIQNFSQSTTGIKVIQNKNKGFSVNRNHAIQISKGKIIVLINPYYTFKKTFLETHYKFHTQDKENKYLLQTNSSFNPKNSIEKWLDKKSYLFEDLIASYHNFYKSESIPDLNPKYLSLNNLSFKKEVFKKIKFNPWQDLPNGENLEFALKANNLKTFFLNKELSENLEELNIEKLQKIIEKNGKNFSELCLKYPEYYQLPSNFLKNINKIIKKDFVYESIKKISPILYPVTNKLFYYSLTLKHFFLGLNQKDNLK